MIHLKQLLAAMIGAAFVVGTEGIVQAAVLGSWTRNTLPNFSTGINPGEFIPSFNLSFALKAANFQPLSAASTAPDRQLLALVP